MDPAIDRDGIDRDGWELVVMVTLLGGLSGYAAFCKESVGVVAQTEGTVALESGTNRPSDKDRPADRKLRAERLEAAAAIAEEMRESLAGSWRSVQEWGI